MYTGRYCYYDAFPVLTLVFLHELLTLIAKILLVPPIVVRLSFELVVGTSAILC